LIETSLPELSKQNPNESGDSTEPSAITV